MDIKKSLNKLNWSWFKKVPLILQSEMAECGLACVTMIINHYNYNEDLFSLRNKFKLSSKGLDLGQIKNILTSLKFESRALSLELEELSLLQKPCILHWGFNHFVILTKVSEKYVYINDPAFGNRKLTLKECSNFFTGIALEVWPSVDFKPKEKNSSISIKDIIRNLYSIKSSVIKIISLSILVEIVALFLPLGNQILLDHVIKSNDISLLLMVCSILFFSNIFSTILSMIRRWITIKMNASIDLQWEISFFSRLLKIPLDFFEKRHLGDIKSRFDSLNNIYLTITSSINSFTISLIVLISVTIMMCIYNVFLFLLVLLFSLLYIIIRIVTYFKFKQINEELIHKESLVNTHFMESLYGIHTIKSLNLNQKRGEYWSSLLINYTNSSISATKYSSFYSGIEKLIFTIEEIIILGMGVYFIMNNTLTLGMFIAFNVYRSSFSSNISTIIDKVIDLKMLSIHYNRVADIALSSTEEEKASSSLDIAFNDNVSNANILEIRNLSYSYDLISEPIIKNLSFDIALNDNVVIIGPSGCGKTTLLKIMMGLLHVEQGNILFNKVDIKKLGYASYRENIACVLQEDHLFSGSLAMNISCFDKVVDMDRVIKCAKIANIHDDIMKMPMGYETILGELGRGLSGGQKQRILIARAIYKKPKILFLDEATSHLDIKNEEIINKNIAELNLTKILVAHRESTINSANRIIDLTQYKKN